MRGQASTEYLVVIAVIVLIALAVVAVLGGFIEIGGGVDDKASKAYWRTAEMGLMDWQIQEDGSVVLRLRNNGDGSIGVTAISLGGEDIGVTPFNLKVGGEKTAAGSVSPGSGEYSKHVTLSYESGRYSIIKNFEGLKPVVGVYTASGGGGGGSTTTTASGSTSTTSTTSTTSSTSTTLSSTPLSACGTLDAADTTYVLSQNVASSGTCFTIGAAGVTLDCSGYTINYSQSAVGYGIDNSGGYDNVSVQNCVIEQTNSVFSSSYGVYFTSSSNNTLTNNLITSSSSYGVYLVSSSSNTMTGNNISSSNYGVYLDSSSSNTMAGNNISSSNYGVALYSSSNNNVLTSNTITSSSSQGVYLLSSSNNTLTSNTITSSSSQGVYLLSSSNNTLTSNTITSSSSYGVYLVSSPDNTLTSNTITSSSSYGVDLGGSSDNTLTNNTITSYDYGVVSSSSNNNVLTSNTITSSSRQGVLLSLSSNNTLTSNNISSYGQGVSLTHSSSNNTLTSNTITSSSGNGVYLSYSDNNNNVLTSNNISSYHDGVSLSSSNNNVLTSNIITSSSGNGVYLSYSSNNNVLTSNAITSSYYYGVYFSFSNSNTLTSNNISSPDYNLYFQSSSEASFIDQQIGSYSFAGGGNIVYFRNSSAGEIRFLAPLTGSGNSLSDAVRIQNNLVYVDGSGSPGLSKPANITLYGLSLTNPKPQFDLTGGGGWTDCTPSSNPACEEISYSGGVFTFNTTHFTSFRAVEGPTQVSSCGTAVDIAGGSYELSQDVSTTGTCFTVSADNIVFDCKGHTLSGDDGFSDDGFKVSGVSGVTIKNCVIQDFGNGVSISTTSNSLITGVNATSNYYGISVGLNGNSNTFTDIMAGSNSLGVKLSSASSNTFTRVNTSHNIGRGIWVYRGTSNNFNDIESHSNGGPGIRVGEGSSNTFNNVTASSNTETNVYIWRSDYNTVKNSNISAGSLSVLFSNTGANGNILYGNYLGTSSKVLNPVNNFFSKTISGTPVGNLWDDFGSADCSSSTMKSESGYTYQPCTVEDYLLSGATDPGPLLDRSP